MMNTISILGSTGSIGRQTLDVAEQLGLRVAALTANSNVERMEAQCRKFRPRLAVMTEEAAAKELAVRLQDTSVKVLAGTDALVDAAVIPEAETVVTAVVGMVGLKATLAAIREKKRIALANKETLVCAGELVMSEADRCGAEIVPVDSEHSAIFQCLQGCADRREIRRLILTCSGGPFFGKTPGELQKVTKADALRHPNWKMGAKITIDSATMMNKGFEVIEAKWLFGVDFDNIHVVVQPKSVIHSMIQFKDGSVIAQLGTPDMRLPIQYALCYPDRRFLKGDRLDFHMLKQITFEEPDRKTFKGLPMAVEAARAGGSMPTVFNAANELAVRKFLQKKISFLDIYEIIGQSMSRHTAVKDPDLDQILEIEKETYRWIESRW